MRERYTAIYIWERYIYIERSRRAREIYIHIDRDRDIDGRGEAMRGYGRGCDAC